MRKGQKCSEETKRKMSLASKGKKKNYPSHRKGKTGIYSPETIQKMREAKLGKKQLPETIRKRAKKLKGRIVSSETREKLSLVLKGKGSKQQKKICETCSGDFWVKQADISRNHGRFCSRACYSKWRHGKNNPAWLGGVTTKNELIRKSNRYSQWRTKILERDNFTCQECQRRGGTLHVHHLKPFALYTELRFEITNGQTLCIDCHKQTPTYGKLSLKEKSKVLESIN